MDKLVEKFQLLNRCYNKLKEAFDAEKNTERERMYEKNMLEDKAGMVRNIPMLRDFKMTKNEVETRCKNNDRLREKLGRWWEG